MTKLIVYGWPNAKLRDLLPDRILIAYPELGLGEMAAPPAPPHAPLLPAPA